MMMAQPGRVKCATVAAHHNFMAMLLERTPAAQRHNLLLPLKSQGDAEILLRAINEKFNNNVLIDELEDTLVQNGVLNPSDVESLAGAIYPNDKDKARRLWTILSGLHYTVFTTQVLPVLCKRHYHIIPARFWRHTACECPQTQTAEQHGEVRQESVGETPATECLRCLMQRRLRPPSVADFLFKYKAINYDRYVQLTLNHRLVPPKWEECFAAFKDVPAHRVQDCLEEWMSVLRNHGLPVPDDLRPFLTAGFPCVCSRPISCPKADSGRYDPATLTRRVVWREYLARWKQRGSIDSIDNSESLYAPTEHSSARSSFDSVLSSEIPHGTQGPDDARGLAPSRQDTIGQVTAAEQLLCARRPVVKTIGTGQDGNGQTDHQQTDVTAVLNPLPDHSLVKEAGQTELLPQSFTATDGPVLPQLSKTSDMIRFFQSLNRYYPEHINATSAEKNRTLNIRHSSSSDAGAVDQDYKDKTWHGRHMKSCSRMNLQHCESTESLTPRNLGEMSAQSRTSRLSMEIKELEDARSLADVNIGGDSQTQETHDEDDFDESFGETESLSSASFCSTTISTVIQADRIGQSRTCDSASHRDPKKRHSAPVGCLQEPADQPTSQPSGPFQDGSTLPRTQKMTPSEKRASWSQSPHKRQDSTSSEETSKCGSWSPPYSENAIDGGQPTLSSENKEFFPVTAKENNSCQGKVSCSQEDAKFPDSCGTPSLVQTNSLSHRQTPSVAQRMMVPASLLPQNMSPDDEKFKNITKVLLKGHHEKLQTVTAGMSRSAKPTRLSPPAGNVPDPLDSHLPTNHTPATPHPERTLSADHTPTTPLPECPVSIPHLSNDHSPEAELRGKRWEELGDRSPNSTPKRGSLTWEAVERARKNPDLLDLRSFVAASKITTSQDLRSYFEKADIIDGTSRDEILLLLQTHQDKHNGFKGIQRTVECLRQTKWPAGSDAIVSGMEVMFCELETLCEEIVMSAKVFILCACFMNANAEPGRVSLDKCEAIARDEILLSEWASLEAGQLLVELDCVVGLSNKGQLPTNSAWTELLAAVKTFIGCA